MQTTVLLGVGGRKEQHPVEGDETAAVGLAITPDFEDGEIQPGVYRVTHIPTGRWVPAIIHRSDGEPPGFIAEREVLHQIITRAVQLGLGDWSDFTPDNVTREQSDLWRMAVRETWAALPAKTRRKFEKGWDQEYKEA